MQTMEGLIAKVKMGTEIIRNAGYIHDDDEMLRITVTETAPWKDTLEAEYFPRIHAFWPESLPEHWTHEEAMHFLVYLAQALFFDVCVLNGL